MVAKHRFWGISDVRHSNAADERKRRIGGRRVAIVDILNGLPAQGTKNLDLPRSINKGWDIACAGSQLKPDVIRGGSEAMTKP